MSLAIRTARQYAVGDPGLFGFLGKAAGGLLGLAGNVLPGPIGGIAKLAGGILSPKPISVAKAGISMTPTNRQLTSTYSPPGFSGVKLGPIQIGTSRPGIGSVQPPQLMGGGSGPSGVMSGALVGSGQGTPCASGYHYNKSRYYSTKYGVVERGSVCVKNRRRNPLNPRALSRAMSRVKSAQKAVRCLQLFAGPAARAANKSKGGARGKGKCRTCR